MLPWLLFPSMDKLTEAGMMNLFTVSKPFCVSTFLEQVFPQKQGQDPPY